MTGTDRKRVTRLLHRLCDGDREALNGLIPLIYDELRGIAGRHLRNERPGHTLNTTALVHEAYLKLVDQDRIQWQNRAHFFAIAANLMRRILIDHARKHRAAKRGGAHQPLPLDQLTHIFTEERADHFLALDNALSRLAELDEQKSKIIEYQFFGGLTVEETAGVLGLSPARIRRERTFARAWLHKALQEGGVASDES